MHVPPAQTSLSGPINSLVARAHQAGGSADRVIPAELAYVEDSLLQLGTRLRQATVQLR